MSETSVDCWSCKVPMTLAERGDCDGCCPGCGAEVDLQDYLVKALAERDQIRVEVEALRKDAERYRWLRDCPWPGSMQAVGITRRGEDAYWMTGTNADLLVDAAMAAQEVV